MDKRDFGVIRNLIRAVWKGVIDTDDQMEAWYESLKRYSFDQVEKATRAHIETSRYEPKPSDIIGFIQKGQSKSTFDPTPRFIEQDGKKHRLYICPRCQDKGMITWEDDQQMVYGKPCDCPAGHYYYRWGWLSEDEQKEAVARTGRGADRIGECWYENQR